MPVETRPFTGTRDSARWPYVARCSQIGCYFVVCCATTEEGEVILQKHESKGPCPYDGRGRQLMPAGKSLREMQWELMDEAVDVAVDPETAEQVKHQMNGAAQGIAKCIYLMDSPYWKSVGDVMKEAAERLKMRRGEIPKRPTPGCEEPHSVQTIVARTNGMVSQRTAPKASPSTRHPLDEKIAALEDKVVNRLIKGLDNGMDAEFLSEAFNVDLRIVKRIAAQPDRFARSGG